MKRNRKKGEKEKRISRPWRFFLLTSCLSTLTQQSQDSSNLHTTTPDPEGGHDPSVLPDSQHALLQMPIHQILDEFFSIKTLIPDAEAQTISGGVSYVTSFGPGMDPTDPFLAASNYDAPTAGVYGTIGPTGFSINSYGQLE